jgi:limonene-1,2-epoxide hydrolase
MDPTIPTTARTLPRRELLTLAGTGLGALALAALAPGRAGAAELTGGALHELELANTRTVRDFCASWSTLDANQVASLFADDAVYRVIETAKPTVGRDAIVKLIGGFLMRAQKVHFEIHRMYAAGPIVLNERHDHFTPKQGPERAFHVAGVFFVKSGKIAEWTDYVIAT